MNATESINKAIEISIFRIGEMVWSAPSSVNFAIEKEEFSRGGFRTAHKATSNFPHFEGKTYVVKYFLPATVEIIEMGETKLDPNKLLKRMVTRKHMAKCSGIIGLKKYLYRFNIIFFFVQKLLTL